MTSGVYNVLLPSGVIEVYCEMDINGGAYTFIASDALSKIKQADIDTIFTDKSNVLLVLQNPNNSQPYTIVKQYIDTGGLSVQLNAFVGYNQPKNHMISDYLLVGLLPANNFSKGQVVGLRSNGHSITYTTCDQTKANLIALYSAKTAHDQAIRSCDRTKFDTQWRSTAILRNSSSIIPITFFMLTELRFSGCGCYVQSGSWPHRDSPANATAIGLR